MSSDPSAKGNRRTVRIGKYDVVAHIATGGMGAVYRAIDTEADREVALKVLAPEMATHAATLERFRREARHSAKLNHENIVTLYEFGESNGAYFLAMEFVDGIDLHDRIERKGQLDPDEARQVTIQAALALEHAHQQGIVHRDIKPSNFLLTQKEGRLLVKLTDMGLAREAREDEFRVTRDGSTVGTVDYLSPEQARDSRAADIRSDIYSLGCTLYHMLAGRPPFPDGGLAQRIYKHIQDDPPDVRQLNPEVSEPFWELLERMLAKDPDKRPQTPSALLEELYRLEYLAETPAEEEEGELLVEVEGEAQAARGKTREKRAAKKTRSDPDRRRSSSTPRQVPKAIRRARSRQDTDERPVPKTGPIPTLRARWRWAVGGAVAFLTLTAVLGIVLLLLSRPKPAPSDDPPPVVDPGTPTDNDPELLTRPPRVEAIKPVGPLSRWPYLYPAVASIDAGRLRTEFEKPWSGSPAPGAPTTLRVSRAFQGGKGQYDSLAAACKDAPRDGVTVIEICDNGPLFETPITVADRSLVVRAAKNCRPLLVWDVEPAPPNGPSALLSVSRGSFTLEGLDVVRGGDHPPGVPRPALVSVSGGDFRADDCTFSVSGKYPTGVALVRFTGAEGPGKKCRLSRCFARGAGLVALDLDAPGAEVLLDGCLIVGGGPALLQVVGKRKAAPATLRVLRSTLVCDRTLLHIRPFNAQDQEPPLNWMSWDALLAHGGAETGGDMVVLADGAGAGGLTWQAHNCLYAGWKTLLAGSEAIAASNHSAWLRRWRMTEGDWAIHPRWPSVAPPEPAEVLPESYRTDDTPVGFTASSAAGTLGCDLTALPPARDNWLALTGKRILPPPMVDLLTDASPPEIPAPGDDRYHGGRINLNEVDLGAHLQAVLKSGKQLGPRVVFHLHGSGERPTTPIRVRGSSLVLYFEPPEKREGAAAPAPLVLVPPLQSMRAPDVLIDVEGGDLEVINGRIHFPDNALALVPPYLLRVRGGNLLLFGCRLQGPLAQPPASYRGLIRLEGPGDERPDRATGCAINRSVLLSGKVGIDAAGIGVHLRLQNSVLAVRQDAIRLDPGKAPARARARLNVRCLLEQTTVAAQGAVVRLADAPQLETPAEPVVVQARGVAFLNPFGGPAPKEPRPGVLLAYEGDALARGLLVWQGEGNVFDSRLVAYAVTAGTPPPVPAQPPARWSRLWGAAGERRPVLNLPLKGQLDAKLAPLDQLALTGLPRLERPPGANLVLLGIVKPPVKSPK